MKLKQTLPALLLLLSGLAFSAAASAQAPAETKAKASEPAEAPSQGTKYTEEGADTCLACHGDDAKVMLIFKTRHANRADKRTPFAGLQCEACHGPGAKHADGGDTNAINSQKESSWVPVADRNKVCLACHQGNARIGWHGSAHDANNVACSSCHKVHAERDPVLAKATQPEACYRCHKQQRADFHKPSAHPVRFGSLACSDCHSTHGSSASAMLVQPTVNQTCTTCHAEKRGPFLWEHAPVAENCTLCHTPHGSVRPSLLTKTPPLLCQQCHTVAGHPAVARTGAALPQGGGVGAGFVLAGSCTNCHSQVHGSNHPSGVKLMR
ncbi:MAG: DmsE family decaheme c-type cytochrome [Betaproteobacteria bacterium]|nr:MAG: DmsE family decaheme c-type cytochrome [Betaproteobacteria bacterium]